MNITIFGTVWPEPNSSAAGTRMMQLIQLFQEQQWHVRFVSAAQSSPFMENLETLGVETATIELNNSSLVEQLRTWKPNIVLFDRFMTEEQFGWRVNETCPNAITFRDTEDLHFLRKARQNAVHTREGAQNADLKTEFAIREIASIYRCDCSLIISEAEMSILKDVFHMPESHLFYLPFLLDNEDIPNPENLPNWSDRLDFMTIGNMIHPPNADAVLWLSREIWPEIRKQLPGANMHVYGAYPIQRVQQLHKPKQGFFIHGRAASAGDVIQQARVMLAPLRFGAGLKGKLIDAMRFGTPSLTTAIGAEGILSAENDYDFWPGFVADSPVEIAKKAVELYQNQHTWENARKSGEKTLNTRFLKEKHASRFLKHLQDLRSTLSEHRSANFTGQMLRHHTMRSTKFMAKWIEEKNRS